MAWKRSGVRISYAPPNEGASRHHSYVKSGNKIVWEILGSWAFISVLVVAVAIVLAVAWSRGSRSRITAIVAVAVFGLTSVAGVAVSWLPVSVDGVTCVQSAEPDEINLVELDDVTLSELKAQGIEIAKYACRDAVRSRYLLIVGGYVVVNLAVAAVIARRRPDSQ